jgi:hypothetical protein
LRRAQSDGESKGEKRSSPLWSPVRTWFARSEIIQKKFYGEEMVMANEIFKRLSGLFKSRQSIVVVHISGSDPDKCNKLFQLINSDFHVSNYKVEAVEINPDDLLHEAEKISSINPPTVIFLIEAPFNRAAMANYLIQMKLVMAGSKNFVFAFVYDSSDLNHDMNHHDFGALRSIARNLSDTIQGTPAKVISINLADDSLQDQQHETLVEVIRSVISSKSLRDTFNVERNTIASISLFGNMGAFMMWGSIVGAGVLGAVALFSGAGIFATLLLVSCGALLGYCGGFIAGFIMGLCKTSAGRFDTISSIASDNYAEHNNAGDSTQLLRVLDDEDDLPSSIAAQPRVTGHPAGLYEGLLGVSGVAAAVSASNSQQSTSTSDYGSDGPLL